METASGLRVRSVFQNIRMLAYSWAPHSLVCVLSNMYCRREWLQRKGNISIRREQFHKLWPPCTVSCWYDTTAALQYWTSVVTLLTIQEVVKKRTFWLTVLRNQVWGYVAFHCQLAAKLLFWTPCIYRQRMFEKMKSIFIEPEFYHWLPLSLTI